MQRNLKRPSLFYMSVMRYIRRYVMLLLLIFTAVTMYAESYPAQCRVKTALNVRSGPGKYNNMVGQLNKNDYVVVNTVTKSGSMEWGAIDYQGQTGYIAMQYVFYVKPVEQPPTEQFRSSFFSSSSLTSYLQTAWKVVKYILLGLLVLIILAFWREILQIVVFVAIFMGIGALVCYLLFNDASLGANIGFTIAVLVGIKKLIDLFDVEFHTIFELIYKFISIPFFYSNRLQHILSEPWRYIFKTSWLPDNAKEYVRPILYFIRILLYIAITPLRLINAIAYNILIYVMTELYDLFYEVLQPSSEKEGANNFLMWIVMFPWRLIKYPIGHGTATLIEGIVWTVIDIFIPTVTMYHGTDLTAGQAITCSNKRNDYLIKNAKWTQGTFTASQSSWGGIGVYFASRRTVACGYATSPYRLSDNNPIMIVCRVSLGKIINYALAPEYVYDSAGGDGKPAVLNRYGEKHGYDTGEWWNEGGGYWEYCMFDWQNRYNHPWRIRPVYVFNFRTGRAQHIKGGMRHWLFSKVVIDDIVKSVWFSFIVTISFAIAIWAIYYGWNYLRHEYLWLYF